MIGTVGVPVRSEIDVVTARLRGSELAAQLGFSQVEIYAIALAISEIAWNIVRYARYGEIVFAMAERAGQRGLTIIARDSGPGIPDIELAMKAGFSTGRGLGLGLLSARCNMDEFEIVSGIGQGTTVTMTKWRRL